MTFGGFNLAKILYTYTNPTSKRDIEEACNVLHNDGVLAYPTDVNWAFGCDPNSKKALEKIRLLKPHHPKEQPFSFLCDSISMAATIAELDQFAFSTLKRISPGPYTALLKRNRSFPRQMKDNRKLVGVRIPNSPLLLDLVKAFGKPIATTSIPYEIFEEKRTSSEQFQHFGYEVDEVYGHLLDLILDLGQAIPANETTVIDLSEGEIILVRQGLGAFKEFKN